MLQFSLIVCTRGRPHLLERLLLGVAQLRYPAFELIVIHDPNDTSTAQCIAKRAGTARIGHCVQANLAAARNIGLAMAQGDIAAFIDDDAVPEPDWLDRLAGCYTRTAVVAAGGMIRAQNGIKFQSRVVFIDPFGSDHHRTDMTPIPAGCFLSLTGTNFSVRRNAALALGGFDENYPYFLEETDFLLRLSQAGGEICLTDQAEVHHGFAASDLRGRNNAPKSLQLIARSKAYFCHINRQPGTSLAAINRALTRFALAKTWLIGSQLLLGRLSIANAARLFNDVQRGIREGVALAGGGRSLADFSTAPALTFKPFQQLPPRQRLCVLMDMAPEKSPEWQHIRELGGKDYEVTAIYFGASLFPRVHFADGIWQHRLSAAWPGMILASRAVAAALNRISTRRHFEKIYVASTRQLLQKAAAASALPPFRPPDARHSSDLAK